MSRTAIAVISGTHILGIIEFEEIRGKTHIRGQIQGASPGYHGLHIHESGDISKGCESMGAHYNPFRKIHGNRTSNDRHLGDLGNIWFDNFGVSYFEFIDPMIELTGPYGIIGRGIVLHEKRDDFGWGNNEESIKTGNSGKRIACGIIGLKI